MVLWVKYFVGEKSRQGGIILLACEQNGLCNHLGIWNLFLLLIVFLVRLFKEMCKIRIRYESTYTWDNLDVTYNLIEANLNPNYFNMKMPVPQTTPTIYKVYCKVLFYLITYKIIIGFTCSFYEH